MTEIQRLADELRLSYYGPAWPGPSLGEHLDNVSVADALAHPVPGAHSIWEIVEHITFYVDATLRVMNGEPMPREINVWPQTGTDQPAWLISVHKLRDRIDKLHEAIGRMDPSKLGQIVGNRDYDHAHLLHGITQHNHYHAGQIGLLNRARVSLASNSSEL